MSITYVYAYNMIIYKYIYIFIYMNQMNYAYIDEAYSQTNLINENKYQKKSNWFNRICNFFRSLCCCFSNNNNSDDKIDDKTIVEINLTEIIEPYIGKFIDNCWQGIRTKDFYRDYDFVPKNDNEKIIYFTRKKNTEDIQNISENSKLIVNKLQNNDLLDYNKIRDNSDKEVRQKYNIKSMEDASKIFQNYMNNKDNEAFIAYIFEMDSKNYKIVKKNRLNNQK